MNTENQGPVDCGTRSAKVIQVIETVCPRGKGTSEDPCRHVIEYWSLSGQPLAENDPFDPNDKDQHVCPMGDNAARNLAHLDDIPVAPLVGQGRKLCKKCNNMVDVAYEHLCPMDRS